MTMLLDPFQSLATLYTPAENYTIYRLEALERAGLTSLEHLPFSIRILLESILRQVDNRQIREEDVLSLAAWQPHPIRQINIPFRPSRVIMQDFTGVPCLVDLASMRQALARLGEDPKQINPRIPVDLVIDHSVQVDYFGSPEALRLNCEIEFRRNAERFRFLRWGQQTFANLRVVPPGAGIIHQVNLEYLAPVVQQRRINDSILAFPDTVIGTDSHTTMINSLGVLGWGVGGIEAEAALLGELLILPAPEVVGFRLIGQLPKGTNATDLVLRVTQILRNHGVVGKFVEFFGPSAIKMPLPDRATLSNMAPEYGATVGFFPVDDETLNYLRLTGRNPTLIELVERYTKEQGLFRTADTPEPIYSETLEFDLSTVEPCLAGPKRPHDRIPLDRMKPSFRISLSTPKHNDGFEIAANDLKHTEFISTSGGSAQIGHGAVVIAAITSCTNTSNPSLMIGAGLLAKKAMDFGLRVKPWVKTSLAPGSRVVTEYLRAGGLLDPLAKLGFNIAGYGCTTCIGNSGPLPGELAKAINKANLVAAAVLSGNRNFEGRINPYVRANYLASPPLVVAYALAGTIDIDLLNEPLGLDAQGKAVYLKDIWPSQAEIETIIKHTIHPAIFQDSYSHIFTDNEKWNSFHISDADLYPWDPESTYLRNPPFFANLEPRPPRLPSIEAARVLVLLGNSVTTDHISPAGVIPANSPAGRYLIEHGVKPCNFNSYGSRRGNDQLMTRGTFANIHLKNLLLPGSEGGVTLYLPDNEKMSIYDAAIRYKEQGIPLIVLAGRGYGSGSSRDWAAKGTLLLGVKAVIAESFERIHRSNLVCIGVLPLQFMPGEGIKALGITGREIYSILGIDQDLQPGSRIAVQAIREDGSISNFWTRLRIDTPIEISYYRHGGILQSVLRRFLETYKS